MGGFFRGFSFALLGRQVFIMMIISVYTCYCFILSTTKELKFVLGVCVRQGIFITTEKLLHTNPKTFLLQTICKPLYWLRY